MAKSRPKRYGAVFFIVLGTIVTIRNLPSQTPEHLGVVDGRLTDCPDSPNCVSTRSADLGHKIEPIRFEGDPQKAFERLKTAMAAIPRLKIVAESGLYVRAEATSLVFRFVDDVEFLVDPHSSAIQVRSASRVGTSDFGVNRRRIEKIRARFQGVKGE